MKTRSTKPTKATKKRAEPPPAISPEARRVKLTHARNWVYKSTVRVRFASDAMAGLDPAFDRIRRRLGRIERILTGLHLELAAYTTAAATIESTQQAPPAAGEGQS